MVRRKETEMIRRVIIYCPAECRVFLRGESGNVFYTYRTSASYKDGVSREINGFPSDWVFAETLREMMQAARLKGFKLEVQTA